MASVRNGQIVDKDQLDVLADITAILKQLNAIVEQIEARLVVVEDKSYKLSELEKIMLDMGFKK